MYTLMILFFSNALHAITKQIGGLRKLVSPDVEEFRASLPYKVKSYILAILSELASHHNLIQNVHDPINLMYVPFPRLELTFSVTHTTSSI